MQCAGILYFVFHLYSMNIISENNNLIRSDSNNRDKTDRSHFHLSGNTKHVFQHYQVSWHPHGIFVLRPSSTRTISCCFLLVFCCSRRLISHAEASKFHWNSAVVHSPRSYQYHPFRPPPQFLPAQTTRFIFLRQSNSSLYSFGFLWYWLIVAKTCFSIILKTSSNLPTADWLSALCPPNA